MHALLALLGVFFSTVLMYLMAGIVFVGLVFLIVYVGAVAVLFLFVIMLLNVKSLTSNDRVVQHASQVIAILAVLVLLQQLHQRTMGAVNRSLLDDFLRDAMVEPTNGNAVFLYVRVQAMDINALTGLYTLHAILFLVVTIILLCALLGAIILATVTTERATSIYDIRDYPTATKRVEAACAVSGLLLIAFCPEVFFMSDLCGIDITPIPMVFYLYRVDEHQRHRKNRKQRKIRREKRLRVDTRYYVLAHPRRVKARCPARKIRRLFYRKKTYRKRLYSVMRGCRSSTKACRALRRVRVFRVYASAALAPVFIKIRAQTGDLGTIVRRR